MRAPTQTLAPLALTLALSGLVSAAPALAQGRAGQRDAAEIIALADSNGDGAVSRDELRQARETAFARLDRNGDGVLSEDDSPRRRLAARRSGERLEQAKDAFDSNGDGRISQPEFVNGPMVGFDLADGNRDDVVDAAEIDALRAAAAARR